jgi:tellurite resistance protein TerB
MFGNLFNKAKKVQNKNVMEAIVAGALLTAAADGTIERAETDKLSKLLNANDLLEAFRGREITKTIAKFENILDADFGIGKKKMLDEIADIADNDDHAQEVLLTMLAISKADGEMEDEEKAVILEVCRTLRLDPREYGLAA